MNANAVIHSRLQGLSCESRNSGESKVRHSQSQEAHTDSALSLLTSLRPQLTPPLSHLVRQDDDLLVGQRVPALCPDLAQLDALEVVQHLLCDLLPTLDGALNGGQLRVDSGLQGLLSLLLTLCQTTDGVQSLGGALGDLQRPVQASTEGWCRSELRTCLWCFSLHRPDAGELVVEGNTEAKKHAHRHKAAQTRSRHTTQTECMQLSKGLKNALALATQDLIQTALHAGLPRVDVLTDLSNDRKHGVVVCALGGQLVGDIHLGLRSTRTHRGSG